MLVCPTMRLFVARLKSLMYLDTRIMTLFSGTLILAWVGGGIYEWHVADGPILGSVGKVLFYVRIEVLALILVPLALTEIFAAVVNSLRIRKAITLFDIMWWTWLAAMMFQEPVNVPAGLTYGVIAAFRIWSFLVLNLFHAGRSQYVRV